MKIVIDLRHYPHVNFFKNVVDVLKQKHHSIELVVLDRGRLLDIAREEYPDENIKKLGRYFKSRLGLLRKVIVRETLILKYLIRVKPDVTTGVGSFLMGLGSSILRIPSVQFYDDFEYKLNYNLAKYFSSKFVIPDSIVDDGKNVTKYKGFKELAYLHPSYFTPNKEILTQYTLKPDNYVFIREVSKISLNYRKSQNNGLLEIIKYLNKKKLPILLSLEDKSFSKTYDPYCHILQEPIEDIHSLINFASFAISSGDTMAREAALLGTPAIYTGGRKMCINKPLIEKGIILKIEDETAIKHKIDEILNSNFKIQCKEIIEEAISNEWDNTTDIIVENILEAADKRRHSVK